MKKYLTLSLILVLPFLLTACTKVTKTTTTETAQPTPMAAKEEPKKDGNIFTSIADAVQRSIPIKCEYTTEKGEKAVTYIKGKKVYIEGVDEATKDTRSLITDDKIYFWSVSKKQGMTIDIPKAGDDSSKSKVSMGQTSVRSSQDVVNELQKNQNKCSPAVIADSVFDVPTDVKFSGFNW